MFVKYIGSGKTTLNIVDWGLNSSQLPVLFMWHNECDRRQDGGSHIRHKLWWTFFFLLMSPHVHTNFRGPPSGLWRKCNRLLRMGRPWGAVTLSRWCEGWWGARRGLKSRFTNYPDHGHHGDPPPTRKIPMVEPGIEPGTSWLVVRSSDH